MSNIIVLKLSTGETIIGDMIQSLQENSIQHVQIKDPAQIILQKDKDGTPRVGIMPFMPYTFGDIKIYKTSISVECVPDRTLINYYNSIFGSGIQIADASMI